MAALIGKQASPGVTRHPIRYFPKNDYLPPSPTLRKLATFRKTPLSPGPFAVPRSLSHRWCAMTLHRPEARAHEPASRQPAAGGAGQMTPLYQNDEALRAAIAPHLSRAAFARVIGELERYGFPKADPLFKARYAPAVRAW